MGKAEWYNSITGRIINCAIAVHKELGPGLLESVYAICLKRALQLDGLCINSELLVPVCFRGEVLDKVLMIDLLVENAVVVELKSIETILPVHEAQLVTYLKLADKKLGLLINFNVVLLKEGIRRRINGDLNSV